MPWFGMDIGGTLCKLVFFEPTDINDINNGIKRNKSDHKTLLNIRYGFTFCIPTFQLPICFVEDIKCWKCNFFSIENLNLIARETDILVLDDPLLKVSTYFRILS